LTDRTFRFKNRVWFLKPLNAHRNCPHCCGKVTLWNRGDEVFRVTARKDEWGEIESLPDGKTAWICNECRFEKKKTSDWIIEGPREVNRHSVISAGHYVNAVVPKETLPEVIDRDPRIMMQIHHVSEVNEPDRNISLIEGPARAEDFQD
jgi:NADH-quinone oxidoreductase subunit G